VTCFTRSREFHLVSFDRQSKAVSRQSRERGRGDGALFD
jgi:hypothetical protein